MAIVDGDRWWDYVDGQLDPFLSGAAPMAADFYLFMMTRWAPDRDRMLDEAVVNLPLSSTACVFIQRWMP